MIKDHFAGACLASLASLASLANLALSLGPRYRFQGFSDLFHHVTAAPNLDTIATFADSGGFEMCASRWNVNM